MSGLELQVRLAAGKKLIPMTIHSGKEGNMEEKRSRKARRIEERRRWKERRTLGDRRAGQGLVVEYLLLLAVLALAVISGFNPVASAIKSALSKIGAKLGKYIS